MEKIETKIDYTYFKKEKMKETWEQFLLTADSDFVSSVLLSDCGILESTALWMMPHSAEKYLKSLLLKYKQPYPRSHNLNTLWDESKKYFPNEKTFQTKAYYNFISDFNTEYEYKKQENELIKKANNINIRYTYGITINDPMCIKTYVSLACSLRLLILGKEEYKDRGPFGLCDASFGEGYSCFFQKSKIDVKEMVCSIIKQIVP